MARHARYLLISTAGILAFGATDIAKAQLSFTATIGGVPTVSGMVLENLNAPAPAILTLSGSAYLVTGSVTGQAQQPFFSGATAAFFGESPAYGYDLSQYVTVLPGGSAKFSFSTPQNYFGILWGSVDTANSLTFYNSENAVIGTVTGTQIGSIPPINFNDSGPNGTAYVNINSTISFSSVVARSTVVAFEFDDVAYAPVPEPGSTVLLSAGLFILGFRLRRKSV